jgi:tRNA threonylcarbamoyladenosine biosynthesis protein TsaB
VRIGVATIKGLAFGTGRPCVGVSTLESLAENLSYVGEGAILCPMMDARRGQVYNALFTIKGGVLTRLTPDRAIALVELAEELKQYHELPIYASGDGYAIGHKALTELGIQLKETNPENILQNGASIAACAVRAYARGEWVKEEDLTPVYLRLPQAERERLEREQAKKENKK